MVGRQHGADVDRHGPGTLHALSVRKSDLPSGQRPVLAHYLASGITRRVVAIVLLPEHQSKFTRVLDDHAPAPPLSCTQIVFEIVGMKRHPLEAKAVDDIEVGAQLLVALVAMEHPERTGAPGRIVSRKRLGQGIPGHFWGGGCGHRRGKGRLASRSVCRHLEPIRGSIV